MNRTGRMPNAAEMELNLQPWLAKERKKDEALVDRAFFELKRAETKAEKLDIAWEWARRAEEEAGIKRSEDDRAKDVIVRARVLERFQAKAMAKGEREQGRSAPGGWPAELSSKGGVAPKGKSASADKFRAPPKEEEPPPFEAPEWLKHRQKLKQHFPEGWAPPKRISREAMDLLRLLQRSNPEVYSTPVLADRFKISCESVSRILKSQFDLSAEERARREERRLRAAAEKRAEAIAEGKTWAGDFMGERGEMLKLREGGLVSVREARHRVEQEKRKRSEQELEEGQ